MKNEKISKYIFDETEKTDTLLFSKRKISFFKNIVTNSTLRIQKYKNMDIINASDLNRYTQILENTYKELENLLDIISTKGAMSNNDIINKLQQINNDLSTIFKTYGTDNINDLIIIALGTQFIKNNILSDSDKNIYEILKKYVHPISYKVLTKKDKSHNRVKILTKTRIVEDFMIVESSKNLDCFDLARTCRKFQKKVHGIKIAVHDTKENKILIICGIVDDMVISCINEPYILSKFSSLYKEIPKDPEFEIQEFKRFIESLTVKDLLIYKNNDLYQRFMGYISQINQIKKKPISQNVNEFVNGDLFSQRKMLILLLIKYKDPEFQYMAYLLYDLLSNESTDKLKYDTIEQTLLFDSLPWTIKKYFREAMHSTIKYTNNLSNFDSNRIPEEQQICLLKAPDKVKEKAMIKLKEVKAKSEDSGSKARQYLDGLLKIPFGVYRSEPILSNMKNVHSIFLEIMKIIEDKNIKTNIPIKKKYSSLEISKYCSILVVNIVPLLKEKGYCKIIKLFCTGKRDTLISNVCYINSITKKSGIKHKICHSGKKNCYMKEKITDFITKNKNNQKLIINLKKRFNKELQLNETKVIEDKLEKINKQWKVVTSSIKNIHNTLDKAVYGHKKAKRQIERIIGEWMNGEQTGYAFGFEGPPGTGKTSMAKLGIASCLKDNDNNFRPFAFIAVGGSSNGSTLQGHNYTYVGSTWGRIVDILIETKCMNPIIFIDELDKVSRSEHGKEIIGILTHLIDQTQNDSFQDKYFSGVDLDLSKALFIFSYNDANLIDGILLDRIHRVKFDILSIDDKIIITNNYLLPELYKKIGLVNTIKFPDKVIKYIIENYTYEAGVRKLKETLTEVIREINLEILNNERSMTEIPIVLTIDDIYNKYLKDRTEVSHNKIHKKSTIGIINGLWANSLGKGGIISIEACWYLANNPLDFKLTGLQGDVMKESMEVAKTLAWKLSTKKIHTKFIKQWKQTRMQGIHIHCPEGSVPKDGPSAGTAITIVIYSLINKKAIKNNIAITGEMDLQGNVSKIGGLELKILGGIRAGVTEFIFPEGNKKDFDKFIKKYGEKPEVINIKFHPVSCIEQVLKLVFV